MRHEIGGDLTDRNDNARWSCRVGARLDRNAAPRTNPGAASDAPTHGWRRTKAALASGSLVLAAALLAFPGTASPQDQSGTETGYAELEDPQRELLDDWLERFGEITGQEIDPQTVFESAPVSVRTTFTAVTDGLMTSKLTDESGASLGTALGLVASLETVRGKMKGAGGDLQFRMYVLLKPGAIETLEKSQEFSRTRDNTIYHKGYPISYRQRGGVPSIQISISRDEKRADIDVDYRSSKFPNALLNGHLTAANSDIRAGRNYDRHVNRWGGLTAWWQGLLDFDLLRDLGADDVEDDDSIPAFPRAGKRPLPEAVNDFLTALFVEGEASQAVAYVSGQAYSCYELLGVTEGKPLNRGLAPYFARKRFESTHKMVRGAIGEVTGLSQVTRGVRLAGRPAFRVVKNPYQDRFVLYDVPEGRALEWACSNRLTGDTPARRDSKRYGRYFLALFRVPPDAPGTTIALLLGKEQGHWKILSFEDEADVDYSNVPDLRPKDDEGRELKTIPGDPAAVRTITEFHRQWFVSRNYPGATRHFAPEIFDCRNLYLDEGQAPPEDLEAMLERFREAMRRTSEHLGIRESLGGSIHAVTPAHAEVAVVRHPQQDAFTIAALPDELGRAARCVSSASEAPEVDPELLRESAAGNYYAAAFEVEAAGGSPATLTTGWKKIDGEWKIYTYRLETP